jgi:hypothetical protein
MANPAVDQPSLNPVQHAATPQWTIKLTADPITSQEQAIFQEDLASLDLEPSIWAALNTVLSTGTKSSRPLIVRAYDGQALIGLALRGCLGSHHAANRVSISRLMAK